MVRRGTCQLVAVFVGVALTGPSSWKRHETDVAFIVTVNPVGKRAAPEESDFTLREVSEIKLVCTGLIRLYQLFISSQDLSVCNFTQSCSRFGMEAIQKHGIFLGALITSDRLQRCNGVGRKYYPMDWRTGRAIDYPVEVYYLGKSARKSVAAESKK